MRILKRWMLMFGFMEFFWCGETPGTSVDFMVITQSNDLRVPVPHGTHYPNKHPAIMIATFTSEKESLLPYIYTESQADYMAAIPTDTVLVAVFMGVDQITGTAITVDTITITDHDVYVQVDLDPGKQRLTQSAGTRSPFQVVSIPTSSFPLARPVTVHLIDDATNQEIATTVYPAP